MRIVTHHQQQQSSHRLFLPLLFCSFPGANCVVLEKCTQATRDKLKVLDSDPAYKVRYATFDSQSKSKWEIFRGFSTDIDVETKRTFVLYLSATACSNPISLFVLFDARFCCWQGLKSKVDSLMKDGKLYVVDHELLKVVTIVLTRHAVAWRFQSRPSPWVGNFRFTVLDLLPQPLPRILHASQCFTS